MCSSSHARWMYVRFITVIGNVALAYLKLVVDSIVCQKATLITRNN